MTTEQLYLRHKRESRKAARWAAGKFSRPLEETQDHADFALALLLLEHLDEYDPDQLPLGRWLHMRIRWHLVQVYRRGKHPHVDGVMEWHYRERASSNRMEDWERGISPAPAGFIAKPQQPLFQRLLREVGEEGAALLRIIQDMPKDLWAVLCPERGRTPQTKQRNFLRWLIDEEDWSLDRIEKAAREVNECL